MVFSFVCYFLWQREIKMAIGREKEWEMEGERKTGNVQITFYEKL